MDWKYLVKFLCVECRVEGWLLLQVGLSLGGYCEYCLLLSGVFVINRVIRLTMLTWRPGLQLLNGCFILFVREREKGFRFPLEMMWGARRGGEMWWIIFPVNEINWNALRVEEITTLSVILEVPDSIFPGGIFTLIEYYRNKVVICQKKKRQREDWRLVSYLQMTVRVKWSSDLCQHYALM